MSSHDLLQLIIDHRQGRASDHYCRWAAINMHTQFMWFLHLLLTADRLAAAV
jgi:hypothetical protein